MQDGALRRAFDEDDVERFVEHGRLLQVDENVVLRVDEANLLVLVSRLAHAAVRARPLASYQLFLEHVEKLCVLPILHVTQASRSGYHHSTKSSS